MPTDHDDEEPDDQPPQVPPPPRGAPPHLVLVLQTVHDPVQRQLLLDTYAEMGPGLQQELFGQVGAYLSAILDHGTARTAAQANELASIADSMHQILAHYHEALTKREPLRSVAGPSVPGAAVDSKLPAAIAEATKNALAPLIEEEGRRTEKAALNVAGRYLLTFVGSALIIGLIVGLVLGFLLFHTTNPNPNP